MGGILVFASASGCWGGHTLETQPRARLGHFVRADADLVVDTAPPRERRGQKPEIHQQVPEAFAPFNHGHDRGRRGGGLVHSG